MMMKTLTRSLTRLPINLPKKSSIKALLRASAFASLFLAAAAQAQVEVKSAWVRATVPQQRGTGAFMQITAAKDTRLVAASSTVTPVVEIHEMKLQDNVMRMRQVDAVELPAGRMVEFEPGGYHLMLMELKEQVKEGSTVPLTLVFEDSKGQRQSVDIQAPVRALTAEHHSGGHGGMRHK
jgi:copper(I)-binding protein